VNDVKLNAPHTHAGVEYQPGDTIQLDDAGQVAWLQNIGVADPVTPAQSAETENDGSE